MISADMTYILMAGIFIIGYFFITIEHISRVNKSAIALLMAVLCWIIQFGQGSPDMALHTEHLNLQLASISQIVFFIIGALTIVELINAHKGFELISNMITVGSKKRLLWVVCGITFFLSAILDNLTTTIVMVSLMKKLIPEGEDRIIIGSGVVIAANAGGAWTPIGDVTTTMLWIGGQISSLKTMTHLLVPSLACLAVSTFVLSFLLSGQFEETATLQKKETIEPRGKLIFGLGIASLIFVPVFKLLTGLPPFMGVLFGLSVLWLVTDLLHQDKEEREHLKIPRILSSIDLSGTLFFLGILLCVGALEAAGILDKFAHSLNTIIPNLDVLAVIIGLASAIVDNVPLVAASMSMYDLAVIPQDSQFWQMVAYAAGTGGSILIIGSAAGVVFMGLEKVNFIWYVKKISFAALCGFFAGIGVLLAQSALFAA